MEVLVGHAEADGVEVAVGDVAVPAVEVAAVEVAAVEVELGLH